MREARRLLAAQEVSNLLMSREIAVESHLLALVFLLLRLRRRTRFFLHLALLYRATQSVKIIAKGGAGG
jgi:hypothetical protein